MPPSVKVHRTGTFQVEVVGESHYQQNLEAICGPRTEASVDFDCEAVLIHEDDNPHDNQAVRVEIQGRPVGYLSRDVAPRFRAAMVGMGYVGQPLFCTANIRGGWDRGSGDKGDYGVRLDLPPKFLTPPGKTASPSHRKRSWLLLAGLALVACCFGTIVLALILPDSNTPATVDRQLSVTANPTSITERTPLPTQGQEVVESPITAVPEEPTIEPSATPPPTEPLLPTDTPPPPLVLQGITDYVGSTGSLYIVGEAYNRSAGNLEYVEIVASYYDGAGQILASDFSYTEADIVEAGETSPFDVILMDPPAGLDSYKLQVEYNTTDAVPLHVDVLSHRSSYKDTGSYYIVGEVQNPHDFALEYVEIMATCYNSAGKVVRVDFTYTDLDVLPPGATAPFSLIIMDPPANLDHYKLQTQANRQ